MNDEPCDPNIEFCSPRENASAELSTFLDIPTVWWMTILYMANIALLPFIGLILLPFGVSIWSATLWAPIWWASIFAFLPSSLMNTLAIFFGAGSDVVTSRFEGWAVWLMVWATSNASVVIWSSGSLVLLILWLINFSSWAYLIMWLLYVTAGAGTEWLMITKGEEVIFALDPDWQGGSKSGLLWPWIFRWMGLVDENDEPLYFDSNGSNFDL